MRVRSLFWLQMVLLILVAGINQFALSHALYWHYLWFDMPVHFLGGAWAAAAFLYVSAYLGWSVRSVVVVLLAALMVGLGWEFFEYVSGISGGPALVLDTSTDLLMDALGSLALYIGVSRIGSHSRE